MEKKNKLDNPNFRIIYSLTHGVKILALLLVFIAALLWAPIILVGAALLKYYPDKYYEQVRFMIGELIRGTETGVCCVLLYLSVNLVIYIIFLYGIKESEHPLLYAIGKTIDNMTVSSYNVAKAKREERREKRKKN